MRTMDPFDLVCLGLQVIALVIVGVMISAALIVVCTGQESPRSTVYLVTAYCPCEKCCGRWADGLTASGRPVTSHGGRFVAGPPELPFGTLVRVPGYAGGDAVPVLDRGGRITGRQLDVFFPTHQEALAWGRRALAVEIVHQVAPR